MALCDQEFARRRMIKITGPYATILSDLIRSDQKDCYDDFIRKKTSAWQTHHDKELHRIFGEYGFGVFPPRPTKEWIEAKTPPVAFLYAALGLHIQCDDPKLPWNGKIDEEDLYILLDSLPADDQSPGWPFIWQELLRNERRGKTEFYTPCWEMIHESPERFPRCWPDILSDPKRFEDHLCLVANPERGNVRCYGYCWKKVKDNQKTWPETYARFTSTPEGRARMDEIV